MKTDLIVENERKKNLKVYLIEDRLDHSKQKEEVIEDGLDHLKRKDEEVLSDGFDC